jgi:hypothetical protein
MVEKFITSQRNVIDFARYQQGRAVVKTQAISTRCRYCGAALADGENEAECSSAFNVGALGLHEAPRKFYAE